MSTGYCWEGLRQVCATPLGARHVPECLCGGFVYLGRYNKCSPLPFLPIVSQLFSHTVCRMSIDFEIAAYPSPRINDSAVRTHPMRMWALRGTRSVDVAYVIGRVGR